MVKILTFVLLAELTASVGQILFKKSANSIAAYNLNRPDGHIRFFKDVLSKPMIWGGLAATFVGLILWLAALSQGALSLVFPIGSMQYILILFMAHAFLGEKIDAMKLIGTLLVALGIVFITLS